MKQIRLTPAATARIEEIVLWTINSFGAHQAELYEAELFAGLKALAAGDRHGRSCDLLAPQGGQASHLFFLRINRHFVIFREDATEIEILDFLHGAQNLPALLEALTAANDAD